MTKKYNAHFIPNTHLDREWTMDSQRTRRMTVQFLDDLLDIMDEIPEYTFLLDSQAVPLEDYFEIRPENEEKYRQLIRDGRVNAGPWYTALDMNCLNGESIVRNLHWGHLVVEQYGPVMKVGYTPFGWGQISQLPQIYNSFGIDMAYFYRGITAEEAPKSEFLWVSPDGTKLLTSRFGSRARYNFYFGVWRPSLYDGMEDRLNRRFNWNVDGAPFKLCNDQNRYEHGYVYRLNKEVNPEILRDRFRELLDIEKEHFGTTELAFMHGMDTSAPDRREKDIVDAMQQYLHEDEAFFFSSLPRYSDAVKEQVKDKLATLPCIIGETRHVSFNDYGFSYISNDIISARTRPKAFMVQVESNLERSAEPFAVMAYMLGNEWPEEYLEIAWKQFMKCQPHDTIGGCGIDTIEKDVMARLRDANYIANLVSSESLMEVQRRVDTSSIGQDAIILTAYNPCIYPRTEIVDAYVDIPRELGIDTFVIEDADGHEVPFAAESTRYYGKVFRDRTDLALKTSADEFRIKFEAANVPAMGYKAFVLKKGTATEASTIATNNTTLENEFIKAVVNPNGTVTITNKETGEIYEPMNYFQDMGEVGHAWSHVHGINDKGITTQGLTAENEVIENSAVQGTIISTIVFAIPATTPLPADRVNSDWRQITRDYTSNLVDLTIVSEYSLKKGSKTLDVTVTFDNQCTNHRLRAMFPTHVYAEKSYAEAPFDVHERYIERSDKNPYARFPCLTFPFVRFFGVKDVSRNVTVIAHGLKEYEALEDDDRSLALTLMRGYENNICTTDEWEYRPGALSQSIGKHEFTYSIYTGTVTDSYSNLYREADSVSTPIIVSETKATEGELPLTHSFVSLDNDQLILSGIKKESRGDRIVVRVHNASNTTQGAALEFGQDVKSAFYSNLNEEVTAEAVVTGSNKVTFRADAKKIVTLVIEL
jgi:mannosylglycerate hydrolase